jgi:predicted GNAT family N-acyltransferase
MAVPEPAEPLHVGGCHCGAVRFAVTAAVVGTNVCRCTSCRRAAGALRVAWTTVPLEDFAWTKGEPRERSSTPGVLRTHCADCGTTLTWRRIERDEIDITTTSFDDDGTLPAPTHEIWGEDDPAWAAALDPGLPLYWRRQRETLLLPSQDGVELHHVPFASHAQALLSVRVPVFVDEQGVPRAIETDDRDAHCVHVLALAGGTPVGTGRLDVAQDGKIGRVAVLRDWRGRGVGRAIMRQLHRFARGDGLAQVWCHAQRSAVPFYERLGYRPEGDEFEEAGIPHRRLRASLAELVG